MNTAEQTISSDTILDCGHTPTPQPCPHCNGTGRGGPFATDGNEHDDCAACSGDGVRAAGQRCGGTGYARDMRGFTRCYACAEERERETFAQAAESREPYVAYLHQDAATGALTVTNWTGGKLADVISSRKVKLTRTSFTHGATMLSYTARDAAGRLWYGRGSPGVVTTLRRKGA